jgi:ketosteroid isomerase-like protein
MRIGRRGIEMNKFWMFLPALMVAWAVKAPALTICLMILSTSAFTWRPAGGRPGFAALFNESGLQELTMRYLQSLIFIAAVAVPQLIYAQASRVKDDETAKQEVLELEKRWFAAETAHNPGFLEQIFADDIVVGSAMGDVLNKTQILTRMKSPDHKINELRSDDVQVRVYGNVVVTTEHTTLRGTDKGRAFGGEFRFVRVFVKQNGKWQVVLTQATPLPKPPKQT